MCDSLWKLETLLKIRAESKQRYRVLGFNQFQSLKQYVEVNKIKNIEAEKMVRKMESVAQINEQCCIWKNNGKG